MPGKSMGFSAEKQMEKEKGSPVEKCLSAGGKNPGYFD